MGAQPEEVLMSDASNTYPVSLTVDFQEGPRDKVTVFFRFWTSLPIILLAALISGSEDSSGGLLVFPPAVMILFRRKYPRWWFDWNLKMVRFMSRINVYWALLRDEYPSTDEEQTVHLDIDYPDVETELNRWLPLVKWILAIPHFFVLFFLAMAVAACIIGSWFAILFTGRMPRSLFDFIVGYMRWATRVACYALLMTTDEYPPFSLD